MDEELTFWVCVDINWGEVALDQAVSELAGRVMMVEFRAVAND